MTKKLSIPALRVTAQKQQDIFAKAADPLVSLKTVELEGATLSELAEINKRPRRKQRGIATLFLTFHAPQGAGNLPVILLKLPIRPFKPI